MIHISFQYFVTFPHLFLKNSSSFIELTDRFYVYPLYFSKATLLNVNHRLIDSNSVQWYCQPWTIIKTISFIEAVLFYHYRKTTRADNATVAKMGQENQVICNVMPLEFDSGKCKASNKSVTGAITLKIGKEVSFEYTTEPGSLCLPFCHHF